MDPLAKKVSQVFSENFSQSPLLFFSPGRINLIGEHIDYNDGFVMPAAIDKGIVYAIAINNSDEINFRSIDFKESLSVKVKEIRKLNSWKNYVLSVVNEFQLLHLSVTGFNCVFAGNIPIGAGMSSSAAIEGGLAFGINELFNFNLNRKDLALLCQRAEHNFPGVMCGIMDQYASINGRKNEVILLDCRSITHQYLPLNLKEYQLVLINSKVHHSLASSAYNKRRESCEEGLKILKANANIHSFRDVKDTQDLLPFKEIMGGEIYKRCLYVVEEILRTKKAAEFLKQNNLKAFGQLMFESHKGLKILYNVTCKETDYLVDCAANNPDVIGSSQMGGGFGGCTINIVKKTGANNFLLGASLAYKKAFKIDAENYEVNIADGTHAV